MIKILNANKDKAYAVFLSSPKTCRHQLVGDRRVSVIFTGGIAMKFVWRGGDRGAILNGRKTDILNMQASR
jgi:hypothetical protein